MLALHVAHKDKEKVQVDFVGRSTHTSPLATSARIQGSASSDCPPSMCSLNGCALDPARLERCRARLTAQCGTRRVRLTCASLRVLHRHRLCACQRMPWRAVFDVAKARNSANMASYTERPALNDRAPLCTGARAYADTMCAAQVGAQAHGGWVGGGGGELVRIPSRTYLLGRCTGARRRAPPANRLGVGRRAETECSRLSATAVGSRL